MLPPLVAYVVGNAGAAELRAHLAARLPAHMLPAAFVALDALPLTPNGRRTPRRATELRLQAIWQEILGLESIGLRETSWRSAAIRSSASG